MFGPVLCFGTALDLPHLFLEYLPYIRTAKVRVTSLQRVLAGECWSLIQKLISRPG